MARGAHGRYGEGRTDRARREGERGSGKGEGAPPPTPDSRLPRLSGHARPHPGSRSPLPDAVPGARRRPAARGLAGGPPPAPPGPPPPRDGPLVRPPPPPRALAP